MAHRPLDVAGQMAGEAVPLLHGREMMNGRPTVYLCVNFVCDAPLNDPIIFEGALARAWALPQKKKIKKPETESRPKNPKNPDRAKSSNKNIKR